MEGVDKLILKIDEIMEQNKRMYQLLESMKKPAYNNLIIINQKKLIERALNTRINEMFMLKNLMKSH